MSRNKLETFLEELDDKKWLKGFTYFLAIQYCPHRGLKVSPKLFQKFIKRLRKIGENMNALILTLAMFGTHDFISPGKEPAKAIQTQQTTQQSISQSLAQHQRYANWLNRGTNYSGYSNYRSVGPVRRFLGRFRR